mgnify:CR=1 FL=1|tara:strand:- start:4021 stop:6297 length:2277 start_codon:yes stop_codon:yes gene_type:complete
MEYNSSFNFNENNKVIPLTNDIENKIADPSSEKYFIKKINNFYTKKLYNEMEKTCFVFQNKFPNSPNPNNFLGLCYYELNELDLALKCFNKSLAIHVSEITLNNLGLLFIKKQDFQSAHEAFKKANQINTNNPQLIFNLSNTFEILGDFKESYNLRKKVLAIDEFYCDALIRLYQMKIANNDDLLLCLKNLEILHEKSPTDISILENLSNLLLKLKQHELALKLSYKLLKLDSMHSIRYFNISTILKQMNKMSEAKDYIVSAIKLDPSNGNYWLTLGVIEGSYGHIYNAIELYKKAIVSDTKDKSFTESWGYNNIANAYIKVGEGKLAYEYYDKAIEASKTQDESTQDKIIQNYLCNLTYLTENPKEIFDKHRHIRKFYDDKFKNNFTNTQKFKTNNKIRVGYVSPDFRKHSVSFFFNKLLEFHNKDKFEIFLYSNLEGKEDHITEAFKNFSCHWRDVNNKSDKELIQIINEDNINILVDLTGNFSGGRTGVFGKKPSPIQVTYCGYVTTTGLKSMDYRLTTYHADPQKEEDKFYTEKLVRLPDTFLCYTGVEVYNNQNPPCIQNKTLTFASFNNISKISDITIEIWSTLLNEHKDSILLIKSSVAADDKVYQKFDQKFQSYGVEKGRIRYMNKTNSMIDHLKIYNSVDIALDTFPFNGATTTFEALWMGVPVMTIEGQIHYSRVSKSILKVLKMNCCIAKSKEDFVSKSIKLAANTEKLKEFRKNLRERLINSPLYDGKKFTRNVEKEYEKMFSNLK